MNTRTLNEQNWVKWMFLVGPTKGMPLHKTHMQQSQQEEFRDKNISKPGSVYLSKDGGHLPVSQLRWR